MPAFKCPRCGKPTEQEFYGPCPRCVKQLKKMKRPKRDPNFVPTTLPNGLPTTSYIGPRVERDRNFETARKGSSEWR